jgi:AAA ATPase domain
MTDQVTTGRFVGRTQELTRLRQLLARAAAGEALVALVGGEAGIGKTRLADQLAATAGGQGVRVLRGGCVPLGEEGVPFAPVIEALRGLAGQLDSAELEAVTGPARAELGRLLPDLAWSANGTAGAGAAGFGQGRLFEQLLGVVRRLAAGAPLLWVLEDLHWADRSTRDLLAFLATFLRSGRVLLVGTFRSDELDRRHPLRRLLGELGRNRRVRRLELPRFTRAEVAEQLAGLLGTDPSARLVEEIYARSEGNPFFTEELLLAGAGEGAGPSALPPSLQEVLLTRVVRLGPGTQQLLRGVAAVGPGVTQPLLAPWPARTSRRYWTACARRSTSSCCCPSRVVAATPSGMRWSPRRSTRSCCPASGSACTPRWPVPWRPAWRLGTRRRPERRKSPITGRPPATNHAP